MTKNVNKSEDRILWTGEDSKARPKGIKLKLLVLFILLPFRGSAQRSFSDSSMLSNPKYVREHIREISDEDLWSSLNLTRTGLEGVRSHVEAGAYDSAAAAWGGYWIAKRQPLEPLRFSRQYGRGGGTPIELFRFEVQTLQKRAKDLIAVA